MEGFKIEVADVRITPEELKRTEEYITTLEKDVEVSKEVFNKTNRLLEKLNQFIEMNVEELKLIYENEDYEIMFQQNHSPHSDKALLRIRQIK